jgi:hypothetical protein
MASDGKLQWRSEAMEVPKYVLLKTTLNREDCRMFCSAIGKIAAMRQSYS